MKGFSSIAKPLYALTDEQIKFAWKKECQDAFKKIRLVLSFPSVLSFSKGEGEFILDIDASGIDIDAVLSQKQERERRESFFISVAC